MKKQLFCFLILFILSTNLLINGQQQVKIPWPSLADSPWPILRGDMQGTGRSEYIGPRTNNVIWKKDMPLGVIYGPLIGYDDNLYMGSRALSLDTVNYFYSLDKHGNDNWIFATETYYPNNVGPILGNDSTIFFGSRNSKIYALDFFGNEKWNVTGLPIGVQNFTISRDKFGNFYIPITDTIIVISSDGSSERKIPWAGVYLRGIMFSPTGDTMYFKDESRQFGWTGNLKSTDLEGNVNWSFNPGIINWGLPLIDNQNNVYVLGRDTTLEQNFLFAISPSGLLNWKYQIQGFNQVTAPTIDKHGNIIFPAFVDRNGEEKSAIISLDYNGNENWTTILDLGVDIYDNWINHELVCDAEGKVYCGSSNGPYFYCLDSYGTILWTLDMGDLEYDSCPAIGSDGTLYIGAHKSSTFPYHTQNLIAVKDSPNSVSDYTVVTEYNLYQNYPNPFNPSTTIKFALPVKTNLSLSVYNTLGEKVAEIFNGELEEGYHEIEFRAESSLPSGIYFYRLESGKFTSVKKMIILR
ncbi:MAG TPA: T9SS type A sorting domain-containing protein [Ignavibacteriaceae bacterium]|nr:T9SS type A sorting domain-containing protein [Ignavibacteriaceae bacterium]